MDKTCKCLAETFEDFLHLPPERVEGGGVVGDALSSLVHQYFLAKGAARGVCPPIILAFRKMIEH